MKKPFILFIMAMLFITAFGCTRKTIAPDASTAVVSNVTGSEENKHPVQEGALSDAPEKAATTSDTSGNEEGTDEALLSDSASALEEPVYAPAAPHSLSDEVVYDDPPENITIPAWEPISIKADDKNAKLDIYNPIENKGYYVLTFEMLVDKDGDGHYETPVYSSGRIQGGERDYDACIEETFEPGTYHAIICTQPYPAGTEVLLNNAEMTVSLYVE